MSRPTNRRPESPRKHFKACSREEPKSDAIHARITSTGKKGLQRKARQAGVSLSEYLELIGRDQIPLRD